jgi:Mg2+ and Co2+ transporter CorA
VDELWILIIDARHIVTFSSNQSWKSRWPPLQFISRVAEISFRSIRNSILQADGQSEYTAYTHSIACLSGALGLLHRNFWTDLPLCLTDRYSGYLSHLQYRLLRSPNASLVVDLMQVQDELNIIIQIMQQQIDLIEGLQREWETDGIDVASLCYSRSRGSSVGNVGQHGALSPPRHISPPPPILGRAIRNSYKNFSLSVLADPIKQLVANLHRENFDLIEVRDNCNNLVTRTIQLVNIRLEDHGKSIMVFTMVTTIFLPLSFLSSYFGMNTSDIRTMAKTQVTFWYWALPTTFIVVGIALVMAIWGGRFWQEYVSWRRRRKELKNAADVASMGPSGPIIKLTDRVDTLEVLGVQKY